jgi:gas vesicle protein
MAGYNNGNGRSLSELEQQAETTRAELVNTVEELQSRVSPSALKRDAKDYARNTGQQFLHTVESRARENPMAAVAIAAGLALPLWRMVSNLPVPLLLIGAGVAMSQRRSSGGTMRSDWETGSGESVTETVKHKAADMATDVKNKAADIGTQVTQTVSDTMGSARRIMHDARDSVSETASHASQVASDSWERGRTGAADMLERNPLVVGGLALIAGGLLASALPATRRENRLMGRASDEVKARGQDMAAQGLEAAKDAAADVYEEVSAQTREQGLTPETARNAVRQTMDKAGTVIERATSAVEDSKSKSGRQRRV